MLQTLNNLSLCRRAKELIDVKTSRTGNEGGLRRPQDQTDLLSIARFGKLPTTALYLTSELKNMFLFVGKKKGRKGGRKEGRKKGR